MFSTFDAKTGYWQIPLTEELSKLTFKFPFGWYKWLRMPFGLSAPSEEFQRRMVDSLQGLKGVCVIADDILVTGKVKCLEEANEDHDRNVTALLEKLDSNNIKLNKEKT